MPHQQLESAKYWNAGGSTATLEPAFYSPSSGMNETARTAIILAVVVASFPAWYFLLPCIQSVLIPSMPGGNAGPWIVRPAHIMHLLGSGFLAISMWPLVSLLLPRAPAQPAATREARFDPFADRPNLKAEIWVKSIAMLLIYAAMVPLYLYSWNAVTADGMERQSPLGRTTHTFAEIKSLETIPAGMHSRKLRKDGPWYRVNFTDGREFTFAPGNEGTTDAEQSAMARFISQHSGQRWQTVSDTQRF
jgi:hypothetical protein